MSHGSRYVKGCQCDRCTAYRIRARDRARAKAAPRPVVVKTCQHCGASFTGARRKYCSDACQEKAYRPQKTAKQREYDQTDPGRARTARATKRQRENYALWREANPLPPKPPTPKLAPYHQRTRHGGEGEWARMWQDQDGLCYLCLRPLPEDRSAIHVGHDHACCDPGPKGRSTDSCRYCRRGLTRERCNQIWGLAMEDAGLLRTMAREGERVRDETRRRIASKSHVQDALL